MYSSPTAVTLQKLVIRLYVSPFASDKRCRNNPLLAIKLKSY